VVASVAANVLHARDNLISQTIAAWPPCALLLTIELIARVPVYRRLLATIRLGATATIAGIAAGISYTHMAAVALAFGEVGFAPKLLPISVDGLVVVASVSLVELTGRVRALDHAVMGAAAPKSSAQPAGGTPPPADTDPNRQPGRQPQDPPTVPQLAAVADPMPARIRNDAPGQDAVAVEGPADRAPEPSGPATDSDADGEAGTPSHTADAVVYWLRQDPSLQPADIAAKLGRSKRTIRRYWPRDGLDEPDGRRVNGHRPTVLPQTPDPGPTGRPG
jgi:hypothetical protein